MSSGDETADVPDMVELSLLGKETAKRLPRFKMPQLC